MANAFYLCRLMPGVPRSGFCHPRAYTLAQALSPQPSIGMANTGCGASPALGFGFLAGISTSDIAVLNGDADVICMELPPVILGTPWQGQLWTTYSLFERQAIIDMLEADPAFGVLDSIATALNKILAAMQSPSFSTWEDVEAHMGVDI